MNKILSVSLVLILILGTVCVFPASAYFSPDDEDIISSGEYSYRILEDGSASIVYYKGNASHLTFPTEIDGIKVTDIYHPFSDYSVHPPKPNTAIRSITVPEGILSFSIWDTPNLEELILPDSLEEFTNYGLDDTKLYKNPENWEDGVLYLGNRLIAVDKNKAPADLKIKDGTKYISRWACEENEKLTKLTFPDSLERIEGCSFGECTALAEINFGNNISTIGDDAFENCISLKELTLPEGLKEIGYGTFNGCGLEKTHFPSTLKIINNGAFSGCTSLKSVTIPESVTHLGGAFMDCESLSEIHLPRNLQFIGNNAFHNTAFVKDYKNWDGEFLYYDNYLLDYSNNFKGACIVKEGTKVVTDMLFASCDTLTSITFPDGIKGIGPAFFMGCENLESVKLPQGMDTIYAGTFSGCTKLKSITIPEGVKEIDENAFLSCDSLEYIELPSTIEKIAYYSIGYKFTHNSSSATLEEKYEKTSDNLIIAGYSNTVAEHYALLFDINFMDMASQYKEQVLKLLNLPDKDPGTGELWITNYRELYRYFSDPLNSTATPDYVLIEAYANEIGEVCSARMAGDYVLRFDGNYLPATYGYLIYRPKHNQVLSLEEALDSRIQGVEKVFTEGYAGELLGDVNYDRKLNIKDATLIQKAVAGLAQIENNEIKGFMYDRITNLPAYIGDFNVDRKMNVRDATAIQKKLANFKPQIQTPPNYAEVTFEGETYKFKVGDKFTITTELYCEEILRSIDLRYGYDYPLQAPNAPEDNINAFVAEICPNLAPSVTLYGNHRGGYYPEVMIGTSDINGCDFTEKKVLASVEFEVIANGSAEIKLRSLILDNLAENKCVFDLKNEENCTADTQYTSYLTVTE